MMELELMPFYSDLLQEKSFYKDLRLHQQQGNRAKNNRFTDVKEMLESTYHHYIVKDKP